MQCVKNNKKNRKALNMVLNSCKEIDLLDCADSSRAEIVEIDVRGEPEGKFEMLAILDDRRANQLCCLKKMDRQTAISKSAEEPHMIG